MKLEQLHLSGFGIFCDAEVSGLSPGLNIIEGRNEAGKSTTLEFLRALLFGFQTGHNAQRFEPTRGGSHGGWALGKDRAGRSLRIDRRAGGGRAGTGTVSLAGGEVLPLETVLRGADRRLYTNVFAFSLHELQSLESLKGDNLYGRIYAAGSGSGDVSLLGALSQVNRKADELFRPGGREKVLNKLVRDRDALRSEVEALKKSLDDYNGARLALEDARSQRAALRECEQRTREAVTHTRTLETAWPTWIALMDVRAQSTLVPAVDQFPEDGPARLERHQAELAGLRSTQNQTRLQIKRIREQYRATIAHPRALDCRERIQSLWAGLQAYSAAREAYPLLLSETDRFAAEGCASLSRLGVQWNETALEQLDTSIARQDEVRNFRDRLLSARQAAVAARDRVAISEQTAHRAEALFRSAQAKLQAAYPEVPRLDTRSAEKLRLLEEAQDHLAQIAQGEGLLVQLEEQRKAQAMQREQFSKRVAAAVAVLPWWPPVLLIAVGIAVAFTLREQPAAAAGVALAALGMAVVWALYLRKERTRAKAAREELRVERETCEAREKELTDRAAKLTLGLQEHRAWLERLSKLENGWTIRDPKDLRGYSHALQVERELRQAYEADARILAGRREEWEASREAERLSRKQSEEQEARSRREIADWDQWLMRAGLPSGATPETALSLFQEADRARACFRERDDRSRKAESLAASMQQYETAVAAVLRDLNWPVSLPAEIAATVRRLPDVVERAAAAERDRRNLVTRARELAGEWRGSRQRARAVCAEISALLEAGGASDEESFRYRAACLAKREELEEQARSLERVLESHSAPGEKRILLETELASLDREQLQLKMDEARRAHTESVSELENATREEGKLLERITALERNEELTAKLRELRAKEAELEEAAERWAVLCVTRYLLEKTRERFEEQRQPGVIRRAGELMRGMTGGRYRAIIAPSGLDEVQLETPDHSRKPATQWSRGTAEQLYLALRFAFIEDYCSNPLVEPLPVVLDDVLVHADGYQRLHHAAEAIATLAQQHQVFYFTCRPSDAALLGAADPNARRFRLDNGRFESITG